MKPANWTNKWILTFIAGLVIQAIFYPYIAFIKPEEFVSHLYFYDVSLIAFISLGVQIIGFLIIMDKTKDDDPSIYGQGRPFQHKLREEDEKPAERKPTYAED
ncbi:hypothetical protein EU537_11285 [Candidatus Thorarchaeota archaeon]|nr:MAG: hypothetical protein EU537_11285 [Candidatus Thorarchaeota archaeon]